MFDMYLPFYVMEFQDKKKLVDVFLLASRLSKYGPILFTVILTIKAASKCIILLKTWKPCKLLSKTL